MTGWSNRGCSMTYGAVRRETAAASELVFLADVTVPPFSSAWDGAHWSRSKGTLQQQTNALFRASATSN